MSERCPSCAARFAGSGELLLHRVRAHARVPQGDEALRYAVLVTAEEAWLAHFRRHMRGVLVALPLVLVYVFVLLLGSAEGGAAMAFGLLLAPGVAVFAGLAYYLAYTKEPRTGEE